MDITPLELGQIMAGYTNAARSAPASADQAVYDLINQILKGQADMATDLTALQADVGKLVAMVPQLVAAKAQIAELQAKLAAAPHDDPSVQTAVDALDATVKSALASAGVDETPTPTPAEPTAPDATATTTTEPVPGATAPAETVDGNAAAGSPDPATV